MRVRDGAELPRAATDLLTALARSAGRGMPARGVWECAAAGLGGAGTAYGPEDVDWLLNAYGAFVVEDTDGTQAVYRLYHREFVEHLRNAAPAAGEPVTRALVGLLLRQSDGAREPERANPYLLTGLAAHALDAGPAGIVLVRDLERRNGGAFRPVLALVLRQAAVLLTGTGRDGEAVAAARRRRPCNGNSPPPTRGRTGPGWPTHSTAWRTGWPPPVTGRGPWRRPGRRRTSSASSPPGIRTPSRTGCPPTSSTWPPGCPKRVNPRRRRP
ncbi:hypothetical protein ACFQ60_16675 [Streptomyces zhihengii]